MNCERVRPYLTAHAAGELPAHTETWVGAHVTGCRECDGLARRYATIGAGLRALPDAAFEPPPGFATSVSRQIRLQERRRLVPLPPILPPEAVRVLSENRDAILGAAGVAIAGAGAAWLAWRALKTRFARPQGA